MMGLLFGIEKIEAMSVFCVQKEEKMKNSDDIRLIQFSKPSLPSWDNLDEEGGSPAF